MQSAFVIYRIVCTVTQKCYIGRTSDVQRRREDHFAALALNKHHSIKLQRAYNKYGVAAFEFEVIQSDVPQSDVSRVEKAWVDWYDSYYHGYNATIGGDNPPPHRRQIVWDGVEYESVTAAAKALGIPRIRLSARLRAGHTGDASIRLPGSGTPVMYDGVLYLSIQMAANANGLVHSAMRKRIKSGYLCDDAVPANGTWHAKPCQWNGIEYSSLTVAAKSLGISDVAMKKRLSKGYTCDADMPFRRK